MRQTITPVELIALRYKLPFEFYDYQADVINELAPKPKSGHYLAVGTGKTATSTGCALYKKAMGQIDHVIILLPPILGVGWRRWLESILDLETNKKLDVLLYRGNPALRHTKMKLGANLFTVMTYRLFVKEQKRIAETFDPERTLLICDEATAIKNIESQTYKNVKDFSIAGHLALLTGTPLNTLNDAYAYIKLIAPEVYRNYNHFAGMHIDKLDFHKRPMTYVNEDILHENMKVNSRRLLKEDVLKDLPPITYSPIYYELDKEHDDLYHQLAEEQILEFKDGTVIDATAATALWHKMQQMVINWPYFSEEPSNIPAGIQLLDQVMDELGDRKLIVFTNYRMSSRYVHEYGQKYGAVAVYGEISRSNQDKAIEKFMNDPSCRLLVAQVQSAGYGLNLQDCCSDILFLEAPILPIQFEQSVGRVYRNGQLFPVHIRVGVAVGTIQVALHKLLLDKDEQVNRVVRSHADLRRLLYGES